MDPFDGDRVRPVPLGEMTPSGGDDAQETPAKKRRPGPPIVPLAIAAVTIVVLFGAIAFLGAVQYADAPAADPDEYTNVTVGSGEDESVALPPRFSEMLPRVDGHLTLVLADGGTVQTQKWDPTFREPSVSTDVSIDGTQWIGAAFDASGRFVSVEAERGPRMGGIGLWIATSDQLNHTPSIDHVSSSRWHATETARLAVVSEDADGFSLATMEIDPLTGRINASTEILTSESRFSIVRWDAKGFILQYEGHAEILLPDGTLVHRLVGENALASPNLIAIVSTPDGIPTWALIDRETAKVTSFADFGVDPSPDRSSVIVSSDADLVGIATLRGVGSSTSDSSYPGTCGTPSSIATTVAVISPRPDSRRILRIQKNQQPIGFTQGGSFLLMRPACTNDLTFVDWRSGAADTFPVDDGLTVLATDLR